MVDNKKEQADFPHSPFHRGEQLIQTKLGVRDKMEKFGSRVIRDHMPEQHREFYQKLLYLFAGFADKDGAPWASILCEPTGFIHCPDNQTLHINSHPLAGDPLTDALQPGLAIGLLGIELSTRRRNRLATKVIATNNKQIQLSVDQSFGNCPQYIQSREIEWRTSQSKREANTVKNITEFDQAAKTLMSNSDTFFVASIIDNGSGEASEGADISHRGGMPGFVRVDNNHSLTIPDYSGNFHFNTLGNFVENPKAGLLFIDFETGNILTLTGSVEILWDDADTKNFEGAERLWRFNIKKGRWLNKALPMSWKFKNYSANTLITGTWPQAQALQRAEAQKLQWLPYQVTKVINESSVIKSFYLKPVGHPKVAFKAGQFLTIKLMVNNQVIIRTYSLSNASHENCYRISVKREPNGRASRYCHESLKVGDVIEAKAPKGSFILTEKEKRPVLLIAAGIGITPILAMAKEAIFNQLRYRFLRPLTILLTAKDKQQRAFFDEFKEIEKQSAGQVRVIWALTKADKTHQPGSDFQHSGRISRALLQALLVIDDYECYLCGPVGFMQSMYDLLLSLGIADKRIFAESFGPASLLRHVQERVIAKTKKQVATQAVIHFTRSGVEQTWSFEDGNLLDFSESHGLTPESSCRAGSCGSCSTKLQRGEVVYEGEPSASIEEGQVLLCCALPAKEQGNDVATITLDL